jgi:integrase
VDLSKATGTWRAYSYAWERFALFCLEFDQPLLPSTPRAVGRYLSYLVSLGKGPAPAKMGLAAIKAFHVREGLPSPTDDPRVRLGLSGLQRAKGTIPRQAYPMSRSILRQIMRANLGGALLRRPRGPEPARHVWRDTWFEVVAFLTLSRFSDLQMVRKGDVVVTNRDVTILFRSRKNDKVHRGHRAVLVATGGKYCPVRLTRRYLARIPAGVDTPLLPAWRSSRQQVGAPLPHILYDAMRKGQKALLAKAGFNPSLFGLHSGRVGGAVALRDAGWRWEEIGDYGGWAPGSREPEKYTKTAMCQTRRMAKAITFRG